MHIIPDSRINWSRKVMLKRHISSTLLSFMMNNHIYGICILTILVTAISVNCSDDTGICKTLKYQVPNVKNKPEIFLEIKINGLKGLCYSSNKTQEFELVTSSVSNEYRVMDYDFQEREIYSIDSDSNNIVKINSVSKDQSVVYTSSLKGFDVESLGLDWITKNLYFFYDGILKVLDLKDKSKPPKSLLTFDHYLAEVKVFPDEGYLVVKVSYNSITRINADGTNPVSLYTNNAITIHTMALDHFKQDVYWLEENFSGKLKIRYVNLYGSEVKTFEVKDGPANDYNLNYLAIDQDYVYFIRNINYNETFEYHQNSLTRASKVDGVWDKEFGLMADIEKGTQKYGDEFINILMLRSYPEKINKGHPCLNNNGGCPSYCFGVPDENKKLTKKCTD